MVEMFGLLKELTASRTLEKVLIREETRHPITKSINSISLILMEEENSVQNNGAIDKSVAKPRKSDEHEPPKLTRRMKVEEGMMTSQPRLQGRMSQRMKKKSHQDFPVPMQIERGIKNDIEPIAPTITVNRLVLEWDEKIKLYQEKGMKFDQWKSKIFSNEGPVSVKEECKLADEEGVERPICLKTSKSYFLALGWLVVEIHVTWAHLEKKWTRLRLYTKSLEEIIIQTVEMASPALATAPELDQDGVRSITTASECSHLK
ncbi:hypothetical protein Tco_1304363 [Tanacetum coccineum]